MKKFLMLGVFVTLALVSCKDKAADTQVEVQVEEAAPVETPAVDSTATMPADTTAQQ